MILTLQHDINIDALVCATTMTVRDEELVFSIPGDDVCLVVSRRTEPDLYRRGRYARDPAQVRAVVEDFWARAIQAAFSH